ncbi:MAG: vancomycin resistance protein [candidate division SR1 bacterium]|nr:MAG: vancomycin resistance protein [candidate division SR1 bacterium]
MPLFVAIKRFQRKIQNLNLPLAKKISKQNKKYINIRHQSLLMRKLGDCDMQLQKNKITNIQIAIKKLDGLIIHPGEVFSFWDRVGKPTYKKGYLDGILISKGKVEVGVGGGLCQLSNLLYWMFLHTQVEILERHRHSFDIFPDSGRVLPFGSGATVFYNYVDLKIKNTLNYPIQIKLRTTENHLKGQLRSDFPKTEKIHISEDVHTFIKYQEKRRRYNIISKTITNNKTKTTEKILLIENICPIQYPISEQALKEKNYSYITI